MVRVGAVMAGLLPLVLSACGDKDDLGPPANRTMAAAPIRSAPIAGTPMNDAEAVVPARRPRPDAATPTPRPASAKGVRTDYRAIGTEPFWAVTLAGSSAVLERPDKPPLRVAVIRSDDAGVIRYRGESFAMTISAGPCSDGMSDALWSDNVQIAFGGGTLKGCGGLREAP